MRILLLTVQYHPVVSPNVYRWSAIAEYWVRQGHEVHLLCTRRRGVPDEATLNGVRLHRAGQASLLDWTYNLVNATRRRGETNGGPVERYSSGRRLLEWLVDHTWRRLYWPDGSCLWYFPGKRRALRLLADADFDAVISVGLPFTAHLIGLACKQAHPHLRWLVDIEDPFSFSREFFVNNFQLYGGLNRLAEGKVLSRADAVSVTVDEAKQRYEAVFPSVGEKMVITAPLFDLIFPHDYPPVEVPENIHVGYFGSFYEEVRTPDALLELLSAAKTHLPEKMEGVVVHFYGAVSGPVLEKFRSFPDLEEHLRLHGLVSRDTVAEEMMKMDVLLNIGNTTDYHLPSKSVDYLWSGKPVVNLSYVEKDPFAALFKKYPRFLNMPLYREKENRSLAEVMLDFFLRNQGKAVPAKIIKELGDPYTLEVIASRYLNLLEG